MGNLHDSGLLINGGTLLPIDSLSAAVSIIGILTKDCGQLLSRCLRSLKACAPWLGASCLVILDDGEGRVDASVEALAKEVFPGSCFYVRMKAVRALVRSARDRALVEEPVLGDISLQRNLLMVLRHLTLENTVLMLDEDIVITPELLVEMLSRRESPIVGVSISGVDSRDFITRALSECSSLLDENSNPTRGLGSLARPRHTDVVSGGVLLLRGVPTWYPFCCGYNETWNWCLIQSMLQGIKPTKLRHTALHLPNKSPLPTFARIVWEQVGVLVYRILKRRRSSMKSMEDLLEIPRWCSSLLSELSPVIRVETLYQHLQNLDKHSLSVEPFTEPIRLGDIDQLLDLMRAIDWISETDRWTQRYLDYCQQFADLSPSWIAKVLQPIGDRPAA